MQKHTHTDTHTHTHRDSNEYPIVAFSKNATIKINVNGAQVEHRLIDIRSNQQPVLPGLYLLRHHFSGIFMQKNNLYLNAALSTCNKTFTAKVLKKQYKKIVLDIFIIKKNL